MFEALDEAREELKRVDHLIYVSLKYTRTVDVLINIMKRMVEAYEFLIESLLKYALSKNKIIEIPGTYKERCALVKKNFEEKEIQDSINLYLFIREILKASYERESEYRRHVTLRTYINGKEEIINIDIITQYYHAQQEFANLVEKIIREEKE